MHTERLLITLETSYSPQRSERSTIQKAIEHEFKSDNNNRDIPRSPSGCTRHPLLARCYIFRNFGPFVATEACVHGASRLTCLQGPFLPLRRSAVVTTWHNAALARQVSNWQNPPDAARTNDQGNPDSGKGFQHTETSECERRMLLFNRSMTSCHPPSDQTCSDVCEIVSAATALRACQPIALGGGGACSSTLSPTSSVCQACKEPCKFLKLPKKSGSVTVPGRAARHESKSWCPTHDFTSRPTCTPCHGVATCGPGVAHYDARRNFTFFRPNLSSALPAVPGPGSRSRATKPLLSWLSHLHYDSGMWRCTCTL